MWLIIAPNPVMTPALLEKGRSREGVSEDFVFI